MDAITILLSILIALGALLFIGGIIWAGIVSYKNHPETMPQFLIQAITVIGGVLATNLGAVLGLTIAKNVGTLALQSQTAVSITGRNLQLAAAYLYVFGLIIALIFWMVNRFSTEPNKVVSTLPELSKTLLGVIVGAIAVALSVTTSA